MSDQHVLRFGAAETLALEIPAAKLLAHCGHPHGAALDDPLAAVAAALVEPHDFPPLPSATVPGDKVVIAVNHGVPQAAAIVGGIVQALTHGPVASRDIRILLPPRSDKEHSIKEFLPEKKGAEIRVQVHDPNRSDQMAYLAASQSGDPIMMSRRICDADLVVPVGCLRPAGAWGQSAATLGVFPAFADSATARRLQHYGGHSQKRNVESSAAEILEATWLLGNRFTVQTISAEEDQLLHVLSGDIDTVGRVGGRLASKAWESVVPRRARVVVAAIPGDRDQQCWENVIRAIHAASRVVRDDGAIVVCTELREPPRAFWRQTLGPFESDDSQMADGDDSSADGAFGKYIADTMTSARIYLLSELREDLVEDVGFAPVESAKEVGNLCRRMGECLLLANAQHAIPLLQK